MPAETEYPALVATGSTVFYTHATNLSSEGESDLRITSLTFPQLHLRLPNTNDAAALLRLFTDHRNVQHDKSCAGLDSSDAIEHLIKQWQVVDLPLQRANIVIEIDGKTVGTGGLGWIGRRKTDDKLIGDAGFMLDTFYRGSGFMLDTFYRGSGYGYESLCMVIDYGFAVLGMDEIHIACVDSNTAFKGLMNKKLGFPPEAIEDKLFGNEWIWRITKEAWEDTIPGGAFGPPKLRPLLVVRGVAGFFGIWGFYVSLRYLALAEATLINFLAPVLAALLLGLLPGQQRCSVAQVLAALVAVIGLLCVLQPWNAHVTNTSREHALAIGAALIGVLGGAVSFLTMSCLGEHVHPMTTVAYFAPICTLLSGASLIIQQQGLTFPSTAVGWLFVCVLGILGFAMHWLMAASLMTGDSKKALHIVNLQVVFAMLADKIVWRLEPGWWKFAGAALIVGSVIFVAAVREPEGYTLVGEVDEEEKIETEYTNH
ncbi:hypothetical protein J4E81_000656 [Alternaria sp. BMP 2799]|nr:hypothetical protein J4E81_000656 [Alternaria sp. BMP 2799]